MLLNVTHNEADYLQYSATELLEIGVPKSKIDAAIYDYKVHFIRDKRNGYLGKTDWTQMPDAPLTAEKKTEFAEYRQALRDITNNLDNSDEVVWPTEPTL